MRWFNYLQIRYSAYKVKKTFEKNPKAYLVGDDMPADMFKSMYLSAREINMGAEKRLKSGKLGKDDFKSAKNTLYGIGPMINILEYRVKHRPDNSGNTKDVLREVKKTRSLMEKTLTKEEK